MGTIKVRWLGHSAFHFQGTKSVWVDPFLTGNPKAPIATKDVTAADLVLVTHSHEDHLGDACEIARKTGATLVSTHEIAVRAAEQGVKKSEGMNIGGTITANGVKVNMVLALHSTGYGDATGLIFEMDGKTIYHTGDTGLFSDMKLYAEFFKVDLLCLPIGDRYTMGPPSAAKAVEFVKPKKVIPMHFDTWPIIGQDPKKFRDLVGNRAQVIILAPGETAEI